MSMVEMKKSLNNSNNAEDETDSKEVAISISKRLDDSFNPNIEPISDTNKLCTIIDTCSLTSTINHVEPNDETQKFSVSVINNIQETITDSHISNEISGQIMDTDTQNDNTDCSKSLISEIINNNLKSVENSNQFAITDSNKSNEISEQIMDTDAQNENIECSENLASEKLVNNLKSVENSSEFTITDSNKSNEISGQIMDTDTRNENKDCSKNMCSENRNDNLKCVEHESDSIKNKIVDEITDKVNETNDSNVETSDVRFLFNFFNKEISPFLFFS
jgi:hypothetical protein